LGNFKNTIFHKVHQQFHHKNNAKTISTTNLHQNIYIKELYTEQNTEKAVQNRCHPPPQNLPRTLTGFCYMLKIGQSCAMHRPFCFQGHTACIILHLKSLTTQSLNRTGGAKILHFFVNLMSITNTTNSYHSSSIISFHNIISPTFILMFPSS